MFRQDRCSCYMEEQKAYHYLMEPLIVCSTATATTTGQTSTRHAMRSKESWNQARWTTKTFQNSLQFWYFNDACSKKCSKSVLNVLTSLVDHWWNNYNLWNKSSQKRERHSVEYIRPPCWTVSVLYPTERLDLDPNLNQSLISLFLSPTQLTHQVFP